MTRSPAPSTRWTHEQLQAIEAPPGDLLVSAAAGAGKTAVLVERVLQRVTDPHQPVDVDRLLVVTFTEAAAAEMKSRIAARIDELLETDPGNAALARQAALLPRAAISTLHSFCLRVLRQYFHRLNLDPAVRVLDENAAITLQYEVLTQLLEQRMAAVTAAGGEDPGDGFKELLALYGGMTGDGLIPIVLNIHRLAVTQPDPEAWLAGLTTAFAAGGDITPLLDQLKTHVRFTLEQCIWRLHHAMALCRLPDGPEGYLDTLLDDLRLFESLVESVQQRPWDDLASVFRAASLGRLRGSRGAGVDIELRERVKSLREDVKKSLKRLQQQFFQQEHRDNLARLHRLERPMQALVNLVKEYDQAYRAAKEVAGGIDYNDLERHCLALLSDGGDPSRPSDIALALARRFDEVIVDEYQDINPLQDAILGLLAGEGGREAPGSGSARRFMVGDVRQSIYRFRLAEPGLFLRRRRDYPLDSSGSPRRIELQHNFRSRATILNAVNYLFRQLFATTVGELGFGPDAEMKPGLAYDGPDPEVEVHILERDPGELARPGSEAGGGRIATEPDEREAILVARLIRELLGMDGGRPESVWQGDGSRRPLRPGDIAILLRSPRHRANVFVQVLADHGIPAAAELRTGYLDAVEVSVFLNLLRVIDNPRQDIPLASVLHSPLVGFDSRELAEIRLALPSGTMWDACRHAVKDDSVRAVTRQRLEKFMGALQRWRTLARAKPLGDVVWQLLRDTAFQDYVAGMPGGPQRVENLKRLLELATGYDRFSRQGLPGFLHFIERLRENHVDLGAAVPEGQGDDAVQIMSIHKSKGLEFPVVFVADLGRQFNRDDLDAPVLVHRRLGLGPRYIDRDQGVRSDSLARLAIRHRLLTEALAEEMRVLYVAMTRARERLVLVGSVRDLPKAVREWASVAYHEPEPLPDAYVAGAASYLDWIMPCLVRHRDGRSLRQAAEFAGLPANRRLHDDPSRWRIRLYSGPEVAQLDLAGRSRPASGRTGGVWQRILSGQPINSQETAVAAAELARRLSTQPLSLPPASRYYAKASVTELSRRWGGSEATGAGMEEADQLVPGAAEEDGWRPALPRLWRAGDAGADVEPSPVEIGTAVHLTLQHLDLSGPLTADMVARQIEALVNRHILTPEQARLVPVAGITAFFDTEVGQRMKQAAQAGHLRRELPFSLRLGADHVYGSGAPADEWVLVQGVIDALWEEDGRLYLVDFKTDRVDRDRASMQARRYRRQMSLYSTAAEAVFQRKLGSAYLYFVRAGIVVSFPSTGNSRTGSSCV